MVARPKPYTRYPFPVTPAPPFSWAQTLAALATFAAVPDRGRRVAEAARPPAVPGAEAGAPTSEEGSWELAMRLEDGDQRLVTVRLSPAPGEGPYAPDIRLTVSNGQDLTLGEAQSVWDQLDQFLSLSLDLRPLVDEARNDPAFQPVAAALFGFHPPRFRSAFQAACWTIVRQRTPQKFAVATMQRLTALLGTEVATGTAASLHLFPTPGAMAHGAREGLLAATNNVRKVERLEGLADQFQAINEAELITADYDQVFKWLKSLPGLGPWSAEQVMWRGLGRVERTAWRDTGALSAVSAAYTPGLTLVKGAARELAGHYGDLQGVWLSYLKAYPRVAPGLSRQRPAPGPAQVPEPRPPATSA